MTLRPLLVACWLAATASAAAAQGADPAPPADADAPVIDMLPMIDGILGPATPAAEPAPPPPPAAAEPAAAGVAANVPASQPLARLHLEGAEAALVRVSDAGVLRLSGERVVAVLSLDLPRVPPDPALTLTYRDSINILPADSELEVAVNGRSVQTLPADAYDGFVTAVVPAPGLVPGRNTVTLSATHHHRIFCGVEASFGIWTEIDLARSGIALSGTPGAGPDARALLAGAVTAAADGPVAIRVAPGADDAVAAALAAALRDIAGGREVAVVSPWDPAPDPALPRITLRAGGSPGAAAGVGADGAPLVVVTHGPVGGDPLAALPRLERPVATASWRGAVAVAPLTPGMATRLADLGFAPRPQAAAYFDDAVRFELPPDWLALASQKAHLLLDYRFAAGLPEGARMLVNVNGTTVRELPLDRDGGRALPTLDVGFRASLLGPGANTLEFVTIVGAADPQLPCPALPEPIVSVSPESTLAVPTTPAMFFDGMERGLPEVGAASLTFSGGIPTAAQGEIKAVFAASAAEAAAAPASLEVIAADGFDAAAAGDLALTSADIARVLDAPGVDATPAPAAPAAGPAASLLGAPQRLWTGITDLAVTGAGPLGGWLRRETGTAVLIQPRADDPGRLVLVLGSGASPADVARRVVDDRGARDGPSGRVSVLTRDGGWNSWRPPLAPPRLAGGITIGNLRDVLGNYASWSPLGFTAILFALTIASGLVAVVFIRTTRAAGRR